jgi:MFS family permease
MLCVVGAPLAGRMSDRVIVASRKKYGGAWIPEDRLRASVFGIAFIVPVSLILCGVIVTRVGNTTGIILNLVCLFINGVGVSATVWIYKCLRY